MIGNFESLIIKDKVNIVGRFTETGLRFTNSNCKVNEKFKMATKKVAIINK